VKLELAIDRLKPSRLPGKDLVLAMNELLKLLGDSGDVHFTDIREGSTICVAEIGVRHNAKARARIRQAKDPLATEVRRHFDNINRIMATHKTSARLEEIRSNEKKIVRLNFPGIIPKKIPTVTVRDRVSVQGLLYRIEGRDRTIHGGITDDEGNFNLLLTKDQALDAKKYLFEYVRAEGNASLTRGEDGKWSIGEIDVDSIEPLSDISLSEAVSSLRELGGLGWSSDPVSFAETVTRREQ
jgi:hypothetical protein